MNYLDKAGTERIVKKLNTNRILYATCSTAAATQQKEIVLADSTATLKDGDLLVVKFTYTNSYNSTTTNKITFKVGSDVYNIAYRANDDYSTGTNTNVYGSANYYLAYVVDKTNKYLRWFAKNWDVNNYGANAGNGYGTCTTAEATAAKVATLANYSLSAHGFVSIKFTYAVPANATLNINTRGAKNIFYKGARITAGIIKAGDIATFVYDGTQYHLLALDQDISRMPKINKFTNLAVTWTEDTTYADYQYKGTIATSGVTANDTAIVNFSPADSMSGNYAPFTETGANAVYIYGTTNDSITIDNIVII